MSFSYSINKNNVVDIWYGDSKTAAHLLQATWPDGSAWSSKAEAEAWAKAYIAAQEDATADRPGNSPEQKTIPVSELEMSAEEAARLAAEHEERVAAAAAELAAAEEIAANERENMFAQVIAEAEALAADAADAEEELE